VGRVVDVHGGWGAHILVVEMYGWGGAVGKILNALPLCGVWFLGPLS